MNLRGYLPNFALVDILQLLGATRRSGELQLSGSVAGKVHFEAGLIVAVDRPGVAAQSESITDALVALVAADGEFVFRAGQRAAQQAWPSDVTVTVDEVTPKMLAAGARRETTTDLIPSLSGRLTLASSLPADVAVVEFTAVDWARLVAVVASKDLACFAEEQGMDYAEVATWGTELVQRGLLQYVAKTGPSTVAELQSLGEAAAPSLALVESFPVRVSTPAVAMTSGRVAIEQADPDLARPQSYWGLPEEPDWGSSEPTSQPAGSTRAVAFMELSALSGEATGLADEPAAPVRPLAAVAPAPSAPAVLASVPPPALGLLPARGPALAVLPARHARPTVSLSILRRLRAAIGGL